MKRKERMYEEKKETVPEQKEKVTVPEDVLDHFSIVLCPLHQKNLADCHECIDNLICPKHNQFIEKCCPQKRLCVREMHKKNWFRYHQILTTNCKFCFPYKFCIHDHPFARCENGCVPSGSCPHKKNDKRSLCVSCSMIIHKYRRGIMNDIISAEIANRDGKSEEKEEESSRSEEQKDESTEEEEEEQTQSFKKQRLLTDPSCIETTAQNDDPAADEKEVQESEKTTLEDDTVSFQSPWTSPDASLQSTSPPVSLLRKPTARIARLIGFRPIAPKKIQFADETGQSCSSSEKGPVKCFVHPDFNCNCLQCIDFHYPPCDFHKRYSRNCTFCKVRAIYIQTYSLSLQTVSQRRETDFF